MERWEKGRGEEGRGEKGKKGRGWGRKGKCMLRQGEGQRAEGRVLKGKGVGGGGDLCLWLSRSLGMCCNWQIVFDDARRSSAEFPTAAKTSSVYLIVVLANVGSIHGEEYL